MDTIAKHDGQIMLKQKPAPIKTKQASEQMKLA